VSSTAVESSGVTAEHPTGTHRVRRKRPLRLRVHSVLRWLHIYTSMVSLLVVLFFALTGITLNHPTWFGAGTANAQTVSGTLPEASVPGGQADPLAISEYLRSATSVSGQVTAHTETATGGTIDYEGPGTTASAEYTTSTRAYTVRSTSYGLVGVLNDLHKGRNTGASVHWLIDVSGGLLALVAVTGLALQLYIRRGRRLGLGLAAAGTVVGVLLLVLNR
jgi:hypothetical protein